MFTDEPRPFMHLQVGRRYKVVASFVDYDGCEHPVGEVWTYLNHDILPYVDGLTLYVEGDDKRQWSIRLQGVPGAQDTVLDRLDEHIHDADEQT